jgi:DNA topoisomerase-1
VTSKDFRTWGGTVCAAACLAELGPPAGKAALARNVRAAIKAAAGRLGNTPAVCRRSYIHPQVLVAYERGVRLVGGAQGRGLRKQESTVLRLLQPAGRGRGKPGQTRVARRVEAPGRALGATPIRTAAPAAAC